MIIWGIRGKIVDGQETQSIKCPSCGKSDFALLLTGFAVLSFLILVLRSF